MTCPQLQLAAPLPNGPLAGRGSILTVEASGVAVRAVCGAVVRDDSGQLLMIRRADDGSWGLPGGGVKAGETWQQATVRECLEETGWQIEVYGLLGVYSDPTSQLHHYRQGPYVHFFGVVLLARPLRLIGRPDSEVSNVQWFGLHALPEPLFAPDIPVLQDLTAPGGRRPFIR